ncbi:optomotor-blind protein-like isoform X3 [Rhipicephalus sanguineus]|nr:optomotor-blind protein-like isoform X3 [Rhipicephalus sanguineus]
MASASGRAAGSKDVVLKAGLGKDRTVGLGATPVDDSKQSASSSTDDGSSNGSSSASNSPTSSGGGSSSSDSANSDDDTTSVTSESDDDVESAPTGSMVPATDAVVASIGSEMGTYVHRVLERPKVMPSDHPEKVHDWSGWPTFPPKANPNRQRRAIVPTKLPLVKHVNSDEFRPIMELQINIHGRFMQPAPSFRLNNLMDDLQYTVWLTFTELHGGACAGQFTHPESPRPGSLWNGKVVSFARLKLFSNDGFIHHPPPITLKSSTTYRIQVNLGVVNDSGHILSATVVRQFVGGIFFAVIQTAKKSS